MAKATVDVRVSAATRRWSLLCRLRRHPWRWNDSREYLLHGVNYRVCEVCRGR